MQTAWSARSTQSPSRSAVEYTATASIPRSWHARTMRTAHSPRLAIKTRFSTANLATPLLRGAAVQPGLSPSSGRLELEERLSVLHGLGVRDEDLPDDAGVLRLELVEE